MLAVSIIRDKSNIGRVKIHVYLFAVLSICSEMIENIGAMQRSLWG